MADLLMLTSEPGGSADVLGALALLSHRARVLPLEPAALAQAPEAEVVLVDGRRDLARARMLCQLLREDPAAVLLVLTEGGLSVVRADWGADDVVLADAGPAEVEARLRLLLGRATTAPADPDVITAGDLQIDSGGYTARIRQQPLDLTYREFELLKHLSAHPGRVFTREQLLHQVWGYDYFGGTRTVDVHVRRLRAKLGPEHDSMIGTVRNVGYRFEQTRPSRRDDDDAGPTSA